MLMPTMPAGALGGRAWQALSDSPARATAHLQRCAAARLALVWAPHLLMEPSSPKAYQRGQPLV